MKKYFLISLLTILFLGVIAAPHAHAAPFCDPKSGQCTYTPLEPLPCPDGAGKCGQSGTDFGALVNNTFRLLLTFGALFAVVMLVVAGIGYMVSESGVDISRAKERAKAAMWGLLLLVMSVLILETINPQLLQLDKLGSDINNLRNGNAPAATPTPGAGTAPDAASINASFTPAKNCTGAVGCPTGAS